MDASKLSAFLTQRKVRLEELEKIDYRKGSSGLKNIVQELKMVIRRVYPNPSAVESELFSARMLFGRTDLDYTAQTSYLADVKHAKIVIDLILKENDIFGFKDFTPEKEKVESEVQLGSERFGWFWRRKKSK